VVEKGDARRAAESLARELARFPQDCMRSDRRSVYAALGMSLSSALRSEYEHGRAALESSDLLTGAQRFAGGAGRHGSRVEE
jgi:enoyl-CoA hydratase